MGEKRKDNRQIKFRVSDHEYEELEQTANNSHMSVPAFAKKRAMGYRMKPPKVDNAGGLSWTSRCRRLGTTATQLPGQARPTKEKTGARNIKETKKGRQRT